MKIAITAFEATPKAATEAGLAWNWALAYLSKGHAVTVFTATPQSDQELTMWNDTGIELVVKSAASASTGIPTKPSHFLFRAWHYSRWIQFVEKDIAEKNDELKFDIMHHVSWGSVRLLPPMPAKTNIPLVWGPLGGGHLPTWKGLPRASWVVEIVRALTFIPGFIRLRMNRKRFGTKDIIFCTNRASAKFIQRAIAVKPRLMFADGLSAIPENTQPLNSSQPSLLWAGRMVASKRPDLALKLLVEIRARGVDARLMFAGDGPEKLNLQMLAAALGIAGHVSFEGRVPFAEMQQKISKTDFGLFFSMRDSSAPFVLEAASYGKPSLVFRSGGLADFVPSQVAIGPTHYRSEKEFVAELVQQALPLFQSVEAYTEASSKARSFATDQTWGSKVECVLMELNA